MRPIRLARIAAEAEGVRLRGMVRRVIVRAVLGVTAMFFVIGAVVFAHIAAWTFVESALAVSPLVTAGILGGADLVVALLLGYLASRSGPSAVEVEALAVRRKAIDSIATTLSLTRLAFPAVRILANSFGRKRGAGA